MKNTIIKTFYHVLAFIAIEIAFVFLMLHEFPEIGLYSDIGIIHFSYWILIIIAGFVREKFSSYYVKFLATFLPVVFHIVGHLYIGEETIKHLEETHPHSDIWIIVSTVVLGIFIFLGEYLLHKKSKYEEHHHSKHSKCHLD